MPPEQSYSDERIAEMIAALPPERRAMAADGQLCIRCGSGAHDQTPVGEIDGVQVFECYVGRGGCRS